MLIESTAHLPAGLALLDGMFHAPSGQEFAKITLRWLHFVAGITWIGLLYFFNLVNVQFQKGLDAETKKKVNPDLLGRTLWYFRWGALVTVLVGFGYYAMYILRPDVVNARNLGGGQAHTSIVLLVWLLLPIITFAIEFGIIQKVSALTKDGRVLAVVILILVGLMAALIIYWINTELTIKGTSYASNKSFSIGIGGALGLIMLLNVWGIIWPAQKRIIAGMQGGPAAAPELARRAFLASRANAWLSLPMLLFMAASHGDWIIFGPK